MYTSVTWTIRSAAAERPSQPSKAPQQLVLDLGQRLAPPTRCADCGLLYVVGQVGGAAPPANGQLGYLALFTYGSLAIFASALVLVRRVRGAA